jgi:hypothetical protein
MSMLDKRKKTLFNLSAILVLLLFAGLAAAFVYVRSGLNLDKPKQLNGVSEKVEENQTFEADLLGVGRRQTVLITFSDKDSKIEVYDNNQRVAVQIFEDGLIRPAKEYSVIALDQAISREYIRWDQTAGPHHTETFLLALHEGKIRPVLAADYENDWFYMPFWTTRGFTSIRDLDGDGKMEVFEFVDEYPVDTPRLVDSEVEKIVRAEFDQNADFAWEIVSRENNGEGRGRKVIWNIYTLMDRELPIYRKLSKDEYVEKVEDIINAMNMVNDLVEDTEVVISRFDLDEDSITFNVAVRDFLTRGSMYTYPFDSIDD